MKKFSILFVFVFVFTFNANAASVDESIPEIKFIESDSGVIPFVEGYELDGTGEKVILPYKKMTFSSRVVKVEVLEKREIVLDRPLKKGEPMFRLSDMRKVAPVLFQDGKIPSFEKFFFHRMPTYNGDREEFSVDIYPVIPLSDTKIVKIEKIRIYTEKQDVMPFGPTKGRDTMLILTSENVVSKSKELYNFISAKRADGFKIDIATEKDYQGGILQGVERVNKIRSYLRNVYRDYYFLLIIADPAPGGKDVPMVVTRPDILEEKDYELVPTDIFYAELTEEMDKNYNGIYGERSDKIEFSFEFVVGRIPVYGGNITNLDKILSRTIDFIKEKPSIAEYRKRFFFPTTIAYYQNQDGRPGIPKMDGGYVVEYMKENILKDQFTQKTLVEQSGADPSEFADEEPINYESVLKNWNDGYGAVFWMGHGMPTYSVRTVWKGDRNDNGYADSYELSGDNFIDSEMTEKMTHIAPFVYQGSCLNGTIQNSNNLAYKVLLNTAVGVVGSSQVSYGTIFKDYNLSSQDLFSYGVVFIEAVAQNKFPAQILQQKKQIWSNSSVLLTIKMETNYFGDPSLNLNIQKCESDGDCDDLIYCNGTEVCVSGYCEKKHDAIPCPASKDPCSQNLCDEKSKACVQVNQIDGFFCGTTENLCFAGLQCYEGKCVESGEKNCSSLDSDCSEGVCNSSSGLCELVELNEGSDCDDGLFCTEKEKCIKGVCVGESVEMQGEKPCLKLVCDNGSASFNYYTDTSLNWTSCKTENGKNGVCYYGICQVSEKEENKESSSGCSVTIF